MKEMYEVRYLKSSEDMILALTGQFKQSLSLFMESILELIIHYYIPVLVTLYNNYLPLIIIYIDE